VHLVARQYERGDTAGEFAASVLAALRRLQGHVTLVFANADEPGTIVAARRSTPLVLGVGDGEMFVGSDVAVFIEYTRDAVELGQDQVVVITADGYRFPRQHRRRLPHISYRLGSERRRERWLSDFMLKEIAEQPVAVANTLLGQFLDCRIVLDEQRLSDQELREVDKVFMAACGTAYHSGLLPLGAAGQVRHRALDPAAHRGRADQRVLLPRPVLDRSTLVVAISQSGETADTLEAVRHSKQQKAKVPVQHRRLRDPAGVRRGALHPRRTRDRGGLHQDFGPDVAFGALFPFLEPVANLDNGMSMVAGGAGGLPRALAAVARSAGAEIRTLSPARPPVISCHDRGFRAGWLPHLRTKCDLRLAGEEPHEAS
jgi:hypothetical protein